MSDTQIETKHFSDLMQISPYLAFWTKKTKLGPNFLVFIEMSLSSYWLSLNGRRYTFLIAVLLRHKKRQHSSDTSAYDSDIIFKQTTFVKKFLFHWNSQIVVSLHPEPWTTGGF